MIDDLTRTILEERDDIENLRNRELNFNREIYIKQLEQENQLLKDEINKISKKELKIIQMLRSIELCTLTKERIDQIEEVMFELNTDVLLKGDKE